MPSVSILCAPRDEAIGDRIAAALTTAGHAAQRVASDPAVGDLARGGEDDGAAIVVWTDTAAKLARLRDQAMEAMARGALIPVAVGGARPPGGFERLPPVDLSGWTGAPDDPRWRFVLEEVRLAEARARLRDGAAWSQPPQAPKPEPEPAQPIAAAAVDAADAGPDGEEYAAYAGGNNLDNNLDTGEIADDVANDFIVAARPDTARRRKRRRFSARDVAIGAAGGLIAMTAATALLAPFVMPAPQKANIAASAPQAADPEPSRATPSVLAPLTIAPEATTETITEITPDAAPATIPHTDDAPEEIPAQPDIDTAANVPATEETPAPEAPAAPGLADADAMENLIASVTADAGTPDKIAALEPAPQEVVDSAYLGHYFKECLDCPDMAALPAGAFEMGAAAGETERAAPESPRHAVGLARRIAIGSREVTYEQWDACVAEGGCTFAPSDHGWGRDKRPVTGVSFTDIGQYLVWLSAKTGRQYRLPSEAEWEYAARAGAATAFSFGDSVTTKQANFDGRYPYGGAKGVFRARTTPVASYAPNAFGLFDMHGNAWEWTADCWNASHKGASADGAARSSGDCARHVLKGGAWNTGGWRLRAAHRIAKPVSAREFDNGFRVARDMN